jgi:hypothetical protein
LKYQFLDSKNINLEFLYHILDQISLFEFKLKIPYSNQKFEIQIMFWKIEITIFRDKYEVSNSNTFLRNSNSRFQNWNIRFE